MANIPSINNLIVDEKENVTTTNGTIVDLDEESRPKRDIGIDDIDREEQETPYSNPNAGTAGVEPDNTPPEVIPIDPPRNIVTVRRTHRMIITDFSDGFIQQCINEGAKCIARFKNGGEKEVGWDEIFNPNTPAQTVTFNVGEIAAAENQHFWYDDNGAHVTDSKKTQWVNEYQKTNHGELSNPTLANPWHNILMNSLGILLRRGLINMASLSRNAIAFYDGIANNAENITALFGADGAQIGRTTEKHMVLNSEGVNVYNADGTLAPLHASNIEADHAVIADLDANYAHITDGVIDNATIDQADVNNLDANYAHITNGVIDNADINHANVVGLNANYAHISSGVIDNATIDQAKVNNLSTNYAHIANGKIDNATIDQANVDNLAANYAHITNGAIDNAEIGYAKVTGLNNHYAQIDFANVANAAIDQAKIKNLDTDYAHITNGSIDNATIDQAKVNNLDTHYAQIDFANIDDATIDQAKIKDLDTDYAHITNGAIDNANINHANVTGLNANYAQVNFANVANAAIDQAKIKNLNTDYAHITNGSIDNATIDQAKVNNLDTNYAHISSGVIDNATIDQAKINNLSTNYAHLTNGIIDNATIDQAKVNNLDVNYAKIDMANVNNAWVENGVIKDSSIGNAKISDVSANKLTAGTIDASKITVTNLQAENIKVKKINGQTVTGKSVADALSQHEMDISDLDGKIDDAVEDLNSRIDAQIQTYTSDTIPTLNNYPAEEWTTNKSKSEHIGDILYVVNAGNEADGYTYRFAYDNTNDAYEWILIKDNQVTDALQRLIDAEGDISNLQTFQSETTSWINETDEGLETIRTNHTTLSSKVDKTLVSSTQLWFTKANTTAPGAPSSKVTSTSTSGNAWTSVVPVYNSSYPYYFYCYQYEYADGSVGWSDIVYDQATTESESQARSGVSKANEAQNTANANIKSAIQLWFTKANDTAPNKPTAHVTTNNAATANAWNLAVPTYKASYPHYFYCYEYQKGDGTYIWSDVVYDRATTENQANARQAIATLETKVDSTIFKTLKDTVDENSSSIASLTTKTDTLTIDTSNLRDDFDNLQIGGRNYLPFKDSYILKTYNGAITTTWGLTFTCEEDGWIRVQGSFTETANQTLILWTSGSGSTPLNNNLNNLEGRTLTFSVEEEGLVFINGGAFTNSTSIAFSDQRGNNGDISINNKINGLIQTVTFDENVSTHIYRIRYYVGKAVDTTVVLDGRFRIKIEEGNKATAWTPAPEDMATEQSVTTISNTVNQVSQKADSNASVISNLTTRLGTKIDGTAGSEDVVSKVASVTQDLSGFKTTVSETYATQTNLNTEVNQRKAIYATSSTAAGTAAKVAICSNFSLYSGAQIVCTFSTANTAATPTLNVNSTGAKQIRSYDGQPLTEAEYKWAAGSSVNLVYDGTYWRLQDSGTLKRLKTAETSINQNMEEIALRATKTELAEVARDGVEYITGTQTASTENWTGITRDSELYVGKSIAYYLPFATPSSKTSTLNLTLSDGTTTGAKNVRINNTNVTTHFPQYSVINLTWDGTYWKTSNYDSNSSISDRTLYNHPVLAAENIIKQHIICGAINGYKNIAAGVEFDLSYPLLYAPIAYDSGTTRSDLYLDIPGAPASNNGTINSGAANKMLFLKGTITGNTFKIAESPFMTTIAPNTEDNCYYIPLGRMNSATYCRFVSSNRLYAYFDGYFQPVDSGIKSYATATFKVQADQISARVEKDGVISAINQTAESVTIDASKVNIEGATLFTSGRLSTSSLNNAYDAKGAASTAEQNAKNDTTNKLKSYSTTSAMNSAISDAVDGIDIGGRNLLRNTNRYSEWYKNGSPTYYLITDEYIKYISPSSKVWNVIEPTPINIPINSWDIGAKYTLSIDFKIENLKSRYAYPMLTITAKFSTDAGYSSRKYEKFLLELGTKGTEEWARYTVTFDGDYTKWTLRSSDSSDPVCISAYIWLYDDNSQCDALYFRNFKLEKGNKATDWTPAPEDVDADIASSITSVRSWYAECDTAATTAAKVATIVPATTEFTNDILTIGTVVNVKFSVANSAAVANLTLNVNNTGAKPMKAIRTGSINNIANHPQKDVVYTFTYDGSRWLMQENYNSDTVNRTQWANVIKAAVANSLTAGKLICGTIDGYRNIGANIAFDLAYPLLYANTTQNTAGGITSNNYLDLNGVNLSNSGTIQNAAQYSVAYLKGKVSSNTFTIASENFLTCTIPTSSDGYFYIPLGMFYNSTTSIYFHSSKDLYAFVDGRFCQVTPTEVVGEQYIYISKAVGTATMAKKEDAWVDVATGAQNTWTNVRPTYSQDYPVLFIARQTKRLDGTVTCTTPAVDNTTTVIDGGNIITGTVTANQIAAGAITADKIKAGAITIGAVTDLQTTLDGKASNQSVSDVSDALSQYTETTDETLENLQKQVDGQIEVWYESTDPATTQYAATATPTDNAAKTWTTKALKDRHLGDLYYNVDTGHAWRWMTSSSKYYWQAIPDSDAAAALAAANSAAKEEQYIYISKASGTASVSKKEDEWVAVSSDSQNTWTTKRPTYNSSYPVLFIAKQTKTVGGTITCTTPVKDDTLTVIDGGHITTGTIDASKATITNIDASKITTGYLSADRINTGTIAIGKLDTDAQNKIATGVSAKDSIDNLEIGGRNLAVGKPVSSTDTTEIVKTIPSDHSGSYLDGVRFTIHRTAGVTQYTVSFEAYSEDEDAIIRCYWYSPNTTSVGVSSTGHTTTSADGACIVAVTTEWKRYWVTWTQRDSVDTNKELIVGRIPRPSSGSTTVHIRAIKFEAGNKATSWTPAPEDVEASIATKANSTAAVAEEQYIYISKASGTTSVGQNNTWVESSADVQNTWTTKRPTYNTSYPVVFIAKQKKTVSGAVTCTPPVKDDTLTVIDGGHITTGTIDATKVTINNLTVGYSQITNPPTIPAKVTDLSDGSQYAKTTAIPTKVGDLQNDKGYQTDTQVSSTVNTKLSGYYTKTQTDLAISDKADKTEAVAEEQYIYISKASGTTSVGQNTTWVESSADVQNTWTTKRPTYNSSYPVVFIAKQKKTVSGTVTCTPPVKDDTLTVIDGGHITTGTIDATKVTISNLTVGSLTDGSQYAKTSEVNSAISDAVDSIEIGGRNLLLGTSSFTDTEWSYSRGSITSDGNAKLTSTTSAAFATYTLNNILYSYCKNKTVTVSFDLRAIDEGSYDTVGGIRVYLFVRPATATDVSSERDAYIHKSIYCTYEWGRYSASFAIPDNITSGNQEALVDESAITVRLYNVGSRKPKEIKNVKFEIGNKATAWTPAPEDVDAGIAAAEANANAATDSKLQSYSTTNAMNQAITDATSGKADKTAAVAEEQYIYISKASGTTSVGQNNTWVESSADVQNTWTTKRPTYNTSYPVVFIAKQKKTVSGAVTCTPPVKDDTLTVIDGGHITTGTIDASKATITNIDASKISTGYLSADRINAGSLAIGKVSGLQTALDTKSNKTIPDTRNDNQPPSWYINNYPRQSITEFKYANKIGIGNSSTTYCTLETVIPWNDTSGGYPVQYATVSGVRYFRVGTNASTWSAWTQEETATGAQNKANSAASAAETNANAATDSKLENYYTSGQTDNAISGAVDDIQIGGRNLLKNSIDEKSQVYDSIEVIQWLLAFDSSLPSGKYTVSFDAKSSNGTDKMYGSIGRGAHTIYRIFESLIPSTSYNRYSFSFDYSNTNTTDCFFVTSCATHGTPVNSGNSGTMYIKNVKLETGNKATDWTPAPEDLQSAIDLVEVIANTANDRHTALRGTCATSAGTAAKVVTSTGFTLTTGIAITVYNTTAQTNTGKLTLNVNNTGAKDIWVAGVVTSDTNRLLWAAGSSVTFVYDGTQFRLEDNPGSLYGSTCTIAEGTAAKTTVANECVIFKGVSITVPMSNSNTATGATLNVTSLGASSIYYGSTTTIPTKANGLGWPATAAVIFTYDGKFWRTGNQTFIDGGNILTGKISADRIDASQIRIGYSQVDGTPSIPSKVTDLSDGSQYAKTADVPTNVSDLNDASDYAKTDDIPTKLGDLQNDSGFQTSTQVSNTIDTKLSGYSTTDVMNQAITDATSGKADKTAAVAEEQYIYISKASGTTSVGQNTTWVTSSADVQNTWTTKRPTYNTSYPVLFIAKQKKTVSGTVTCTPPVKDDTLTVIDGGHITTGTIDATKVTISNLTVGSLTDGSQYAKTSEVNSAISDAVDSIEIGGRNLLLGTSSFTDTEWSYSRGSITSDGNAKLTSTTSAAFATYTLNNILYSYCKNKTVTVSFDLRAIDEGSYDTVGGIRVYLFVRPATATDVSSERDAYIYKLIYCTYEWGRYSASFAIPDNITSGNQEALVDESAITVRLYNIGSRKPKEIKNVKFEIGNKATAWTPAPEDVDAGIAAAEANANAATDSKLQSYSTTNAMNQAITDATSGKADKTAAVAEEQYIYISKASGTTSVGQNTTWVTSSSDSQNTWTTKRPTYNSSYPVVFIAKQKKTVSGTVTCTTPVKDDTLTVIDGGHITTGTIDASKVTVTNIDASKITTGTISADRINASQLTIGYSQINNTPSIPSKVTDLSDGNQYAKTSAIPTKLGDLQNDSGFQTSTQVSNTIDTKLSGYSTTDVMNQAISTAVDSISIGGRNLSLATGDSVTLNHATSSNTYFSPAANYHISDYGMSQIANESNERFTVSFDWVATNADTEFDIGASLYAGSSYGRGTYTIESGTYHVSVGDSSGHYIKTFTPTASMRSNTDKRGWIFNGVLSNTNASISIVITNFKFEVGNKSTSWTPAPEDVDASIATKTSLSEAISLTYPNVSPMFGSTPYESLSKGWYSFSASLDATPLEDSWVHIHADCSEATSTTQYNILPYNGGMIKKDTLYTWLWEYRNNNTNVSNDSMIFTTSASDNSSRSFSFGSSSASSEGVIETTNNLDETENTDNRFYLYTGNATSMHRVLVRSKTTDNPNCIAYIRINVIAGTVLDLDLRLSIYEGRYLGPFKPYVGALVYPTTGDIDTIQTNIDNVKSDLNSSRSWYAECLSDAAEVNKTAAIVPTTSETFTPSPGTTVHVKFAKTNSGAVADLTLSINGSAAKPIKYINNNAAPANLPGVGYLRADVVYDFVYDGNYWLWRSNYNTNDNYYNRTNHSLAITAVTAITKSFLICGTNAGYKNVAANIVFDISYPILWASAAIAANATATNTYEVYPITLTTTAAVEGAAANKTAYLKGTITGNLFTIAPSNFLTCNVPTAETLINNKTAIYIPLGIMSSAKDCFFTSSKSLYAFLDGSFRQVSTSDVVATQTIYISSVSVTNAPSATTTWVTTNTDIQNTWTIKRPTYNPDYPVLFVATQTKRIDNTVICTPPLKDDTTTVIDGGHITTGTIDASNVNVTNLTIGSFTSTAQTTINNAGKTASDYITKVDNNGIKVHATNNTSTNYSLINAEGMEVYKGGTSVAKFSDVTRIGSDDKANIEIANNRLSFIDSTGYEYAAFYDLKNNDGVSYVTLIFDMAGSSQSSIVIPEIMCPYSALVSIDSIHYSYTDIYGSHEGSMTNYTVTNSSGGILITLDAQYTDAKFSIGITSKSDVLSKYYSLGTRAEQQLNGVNGIGPASINLGEINIASGFASIASGFSTISSNTASFSEGYGTEASGYASHAEGYCTVASKIYSHAEGCRSTASAYASHAEGENSVASGMRSHAEGSATIVNGSAAHGEGVSSTASSMASHAEGYASTASNVGSHSEGQYTTASGFSSHAEGCHTVASGFYSHSSGYYTIADNESMFACGSYNKTGSNIKFAVGNGTANNSRRNAFTVIGADGATASAYFGGTSSSNGTTITSDERVKTLIKDLDPSEAKEFLQSVTPRMYYKEESNPEGELGFYAQEVEKTIYGKQLVTKDNSGIYDLPDFRIMSYEGFIAPIVSSLQGVFDELDDLKKENEELRNQNQKLEERLARLEQLLLKDE